METTTDYQHVFKSDLLYTFFNVGSEKLPQFIGRPKDYSKGFLKSDLLLKIMNRLNNIYDMFWIKIMFSSLLLNLLICFRFNCSTRVLSFQLLLNF